MKESQRNTLMVVIVAGAMLLLVYFTVQTNRHSTHTDDSAGKTATAVAALADILNRRSPVLEYLACKDIAHDAFDVAQGELFLALTERRLDDIPQLQLAYHNAIDAVRRSQLPKAQNGCGDLPQADAPGG
jgi:hypothetical protein